MSPDPNGSLIWCFEHWNVIKLCDRITLDFYMGLSTHDKHHKRLEVWVLPWE